MNASGTLASPWRTTLAGTWRFTLVSIAGFAPWVMAGGFLHRNVGEGGLYAACLLAFLIAAVALLPGLLAGPQRVLHTIRWFVPAFVAYAALWCACWFLLHGRTGEIAGALIGGSAFVLVSAWTLGRPRAFPLTLAVFIVLHAAGYFLGGVAMHELFAAGIAKPLGMLAWGVCYGLGFGAGIGWLVHDCRNEPS